MTENGTILYKLDLEELSKPIPMVGSVCLAPYLKLDTWTPVEACLLVCGIDPKMTIRYDKGTGTDWVIVFTDMRTILDERSYSFTNCDLFRDADRVLELWNSQENPRQKIKPVEFVKWCEIRGINTEWITNADEWPGYVLSQTEAVADDGAGNQAATEPASANEFEFSELLHKPSHKDDWFEVIDDMTKAFYREHNEMPTVAQAWTQLCQNPPHCHGIKPDDDETSLTMPGAGRPLTKRSFRRRWVKYTAESSPFKPN